MAQNTLSSAEKKLFKAWTANWSEKCEFEKLFFHYFLWKLVNRSMKWRYYSVMKFVLTIILSCLTRPQEVWFHLGVASSLFKQVPSYFFALNILSLLASNLTCFITLCVQQLYTTFYRERELHILVRPK